MRIFRLTLKEKYWFILVFLVLFSGCKDMIYRGIEIDYPGYEYMIDFETCPRLSLSPTAQIWLEYYISIPDSEGFKKYIEDTILPDIMNLPHHTFSSENLSRLIYTISLLEAWLQLDILIIRDNFFKKNPKLINQN